MEPESPGELARGTPVAEYTIRNPIGAGPTGTVYAAIHPISGDKVAAKIIHPYLSQDEPRSEGVLAHLREVARLKHPGLVPLLASGRLEDGSIYLIYEFVPGQPLSDLIRASAPLTVDQALPLLIALCEGLEAAHREELVHGNLTPDNIWLTARASGAWPPQVRVMDLGVGRLLDPARPADGPAEDRLPYYLAPEQCRGEPAVAATDTYAVGVVAYQLLTGRLPFSSARPASVWRMQLEQAPPPPRSLAAGLPDAVEELLLRALAKEPGGRFEGLADLRRELERIPVGAASAPTPAQPAADAADAAASMEQAADAAEQDVWEDEAHTESMQNPRQRTRSGEFESVLRPGSPGVRSAAGPVVEVAQLPPVQAVQDQAPGGPGSPRVTAILPRLALPPPARPRLTPLLSALLALLTAAAVGVVAFRLFSGRWPLQSSSSEPPVAELVIQTQPPGATVHLDRVQQPRRTPLTLRQIRPGQPYELRLDLRGHRPWRQTVALGLQERRRVLRIVLPRVSDR